MYNILTNNFSNKILRFSMKNYQKISKLAILIAIILSGLGSLYAQNGNFVNDVGGTYEASDYGVIRMNNNASTFSGTAQLGLAVGTRIDGIVDWASTNAGQAVQQLFYTNLFLSGGTKTIGTGVHVGGSGATVPANLYTKYTNLVNGYGYFVGTGTGDRNYTGIFLYDGDAAQTIFPEYAASGTTNRYVNLDLSSETAGTTVKTTGGDINLQGYLYVHSSASMINSDDFSVATGASIAEGNITNTGGTFTTTLGVASDIFNVKTGVTFAVTVGALQLQSIGAFTVENGGTLSLDALGGNLAMTGSSYLDIIGTFSNAAALHTNMTFDVASTVRYGGTGVTQNVVFTSDAAPSNNYGNIIFDDVANKIATGMIHTRGTVSLADGNLIMNNVGTSNDTTNTLYVNATGGNKVTITPNANPAFPYVKGSMKLRGTISTGTAYTMNTNETKVTFGTSPTEFGFNVFDNLPPTLAANFTTNTDVNRNIYMNYKAPTAAYITNLRVGYSSDEIETGWTGNETLMRFAEGYDILKNMQSLIGGAGIATNNGALTPRWVNLVGDGIKAIALSDAYVDGGNGFQMERGSNLILTSRPMLFIATANGRWTNPNTWDEGVVPSSTDNTIIRALVYAGIKSVTGNIAYGTATIGNDTPEATEYTAGSGWNGSNVVGQIAHSITIDDADNYALIIGNEDNGANYVLKTAAEGLLVPPTTGTMAGLYNNANNGYSGTWDLKATTPGGGNRISGLWMTNIKSSGEPLFNPAKIENKGTIVNHGIIEVGNRP